MGIKLNLNNPLSRDFSICTVNAAFIQTQPPITLSITDTHSLFYLAITLDFTTVPARLNVAVSQVVVTF